MFVQQLFAGVVSDNRQVDGLQNVRALEAYHVFSGSETGDGTVAGCLGSGAWKGDRFDVVVELQRSLELQESDIVGTGGSETLLICGIVNYFQIASFGPSIFTDKKPNTRTGCH